MTLACGLKRRSEYHSVFHVNDLLLAETHARHTTRYRATRQGRREGHGQEGAAWQRRLLLVLGAVPTSQLWSSRAFSKVKVMCVWICFLKRDTAASQCFDSGTRDSARDALIHFSPEGVVKTFGGSIGGCRTADAVRCRLAHCVGAPGSNRHVEQRNRRDGRRPQASGRGRTRRGGPDHSPGAHLGERLLWRSLCHRTRRSYHKSTC